MTNGIHIKVAPEAMKGKAQEIQTQIISLENQWKEIVASVTRSKGYWEGEAESLHLQYYNEIKDEMERVIKRLKEHPSDLLKMAGIYEKAENQAHTLAKTLPDDIIV